MPNMASVVAVANERETRRKRSTGSTRGCRRLVKTWVMDAPSGFQSGTGTAPGFSRFVKPTALGSPARLRLVTCVGPILEDVARLTPQHFADALEGLEAYALHLARLEERYVLLGNADALGEFFRAHFAACEHHV